MATSMVAPDRRRFLKVGAGLIAMTIMPSGLIVGEAWSQMPRSTQPETFATLVQMSRDCYPHASLDDSYYVKAVETLDQAARASEADLALLEDGVAALNKAASGKGGDYKSLASDADRAAILTAIEDEPFFQKVRSNLIVGLYNQKDLWPIFGYEGASADKGGYIERGFDDIDWL
ncbi:gluconate 2-dehydrogenase subunit 3 family protein [Aurantimonas sp. VKM B-3413]|uniref:gluconate 2-dehydrogenase subunit 3 family protein n=1 Tax=Aurantimonas sp. VKM B-3413 TaxID=2779401 RepID=UPI001E2AD33B|nr:gluconate 2-dehydrogenase subunit 3 family protein [Aurantimonas sp. VKM B-3413]MCB8837716.1 gluconate 2-dehydrogenase subunit 3 family protein [Aurantimonas sp. VKM B-3413]